MLNSRYVTGILDEKLDSDNVTVYSKKIENLKKIIVKSIQNNCLGNRLKLYFEIRIKKPENSMGTGQGS